MAEWILARPTAYDRQDALLFARECARADGLPIEGGAGLGEMPYDEWLGRVEHFEQGEELPRGYVPSSCYFLKKEGCPRIFGVISVRWRLTEALLQTGGNIGYSVRPSERRKGCGSAQLGLAIEKCREAGIERALLTCSTENHASAATMLSQGAVEDRPYISPEGVVTRRFWISTGTRVALRAPTLARKADAEEMIAEFHDHGETILYGSGGAGDSSYEQWLVKMDRYAHSAPPENVPQYVRFGVLLPEERLIGYIALRPQLNDALFRIAGNTGYCIRPSMRRRGLGHRQLGMALAWLRERGIPQALLTCAESNRASAATILSQGGKEDLTFVDELGIPHRRFWIPTGNRVILRRPSPADEQAVIEMLEEFQENGEEFVYGSSGANRLPYAKWLEKIARGAQTEGLPAGKVPQRTYLSVLMPENRLVGFVAIRPELNDALRNEAGNIGYSIRPSERRKGYGRAQLRCALNKIAERDVRRALLTCDEDNIASAATILSCSGKEDAPYVSPTGARQRRFWIELPKPGNME
ncbi:MAG: GNAT family N-acetyltransferase [Eubacteriales bacterium]|nr:GNAT family N-acetyltransferase [Eubacteriales bacterium]